MENRTSPASGPEYFTRILAFDALRVFAIILVLGIHTLMTSRELDWRPSYIGNFDTWLHFAVPLFVFVSGALVWGKPWGDKKFVPFIKGRLKRVGLPYLFWSAIYITLLFCGTPGNKAIYGEQYNWRLLIATKESFFNIMGRIPGYLLSGHSWYHLYFIPMIITFYILTPLFARGMRAFKGSAELIVLCACAVKTMAWPYALRYLNDVGNPFLTSYATHIFQYLFFMALGAWFMIRFGKLAGAHSAKFQRVESERSIAAESAVKGTTLPAAAIFTDIFKQSKPAQAMVEIYKNLNLGIFIALAFALEPLWARVKKPLIAASSLSFGVYYIHPLFVLVAQRASLLLSSNATMHDFWIRWPCLIAVWIFLIVTSFGVSYLFSKSKYTRWLIGG
ncbi:MAG: acyltransferase [Coriobacteriia bacterium]|nr:acyltransferase [Coriobacteriia bacterium]